ncbi:MAG: HEPN domain-containing protein [Phycisphaerae bacterium]
MGDAKRGLIKGWLTKALHDLTAARMVTASTEPLFDVGAFHCQQAAEKAVKAYLVFRDRPFPKTHDVAELIDRAGDFEAGFDRWRDAAGRLTQYATDARYPGLELAPSRQEYEYAEQAAAGFYEFVCSLLPEDVRPDL